MLAMLFKHFTEPKKTPITPEKPHCYMSFYTSGNEPLPIKDALDGNWNKRMSEKIANQFTSLHCKFYSSIEEAGKSLFAMTRTGNRKAAYIVELGVDVEEAKEFIRKGQFNSIIIRAFNYKDWFRQKNHPMHVVEEFTNEKYNPMLSLENDSTALVPTR